MSERKKWLIKSSEGLVEGPYTTEEVLGKIRKAELSGKEFISTYPDGQWMPITHTPSFYDSLLSFLSQEFNEEEVKKEAEKNKEDSFLSSKPSQDVKGSKENERETKENKESEDFEQEQTQTHTESQNSEKVKFKIEEEKDKTEFEVVNLKNLNKRSSSVSPAYSKYLESKKSSSLEKQKDENPYPPFPNDKSTQRQSSFKKILFFILLILGFLFFLQPDFLDLFFSSTDKDRGFFLISPPHSKKQKSALLKSEVEQKIKKGLVFFETSIPENTMKAQKKWVEALKGSQYSKEALGLLCLNYFEIWPYTSQSSKELESVLKAWIQVASLNPVSLQSFLCEQVYLTLQAQYKKAGFLINKLFEFSSDSPFPLEKKFLSFLYYLKALDLEKKEDMDGAFESLYVAQSLWSTWLRLYHVQARFLEKIENLPEALLTYENVLDSKPHDKTSLMNFAFFQIEHKRNFSKGKKVLEKAFRLPHSVSDEVSARGYFAKATLETEKRDFDQAVKYAEKAYFLGFAEAENLLFRMLGEEKSQKFLKTTKAQILIQRGDKWMRKEKFHEALVFYEKAFSQRKFQVVSHKANAAFKAALCLWNMNFLGQAVDWLERTLKYDPYHIRAYVLLSKYHAQRKNFIEAEKILSKAFSLRPNHHIVFRAYADLEKKRGDFSSSIQHAEEALKIFEMDLETYPILTYSLIKQGQYNEAYRYAARALEINPYFPFVHVMYAEALHSLYGLDTALDHLRPLLRKHPSQIEFLFVSAKLFKENRRIGEAQVYFSQIFQLQPRFKKAYIELGKMFKEMKRWEKATDIFLKALSVDPLDLDILNELALIYKERNQFRKSKRYFERILKTNPNYPFIYYQMGQMALQRKDFLSALSYAKKERKLNPNFFSAYTLAAESYKAMKQYNLCFDEYQKAVEIGTKNSNVYIKMAECSRLSGGIDVALSLLNHAHSLESGNPLVHRELGIVYETKGQWSLASKAYENYLTLAPQAKDRNLIKKKLLRRGR